MEDRETDTLRSWKINYKGTSLIDVGTEENIGLSACHKCLNARQILITMLTFRSDI